MADRDGMLSPFGLGLEGAHDVLYTLGHVASDGEGQRDRLLAVVLVAVEHRDMALFAIAWSHDAEVEAVGREAEVNSQLAIHRHSTAPNSRNTRRSKENFNRRAYPK